MIATVFLFGLFFLVGWLASRRRRAASAEDFILAGRSLPLGLAVLTMTATWVDGGYLLGTAEGVQRSSLALGLQGGLCFGLSLILGGLFFARPMHRLGFTTLIDPFERRFGRHWAAVLALPALLAEMFWSAELLVAVGSTFGVAFRLSLSVAILAAALVVIAYTMIGGLWSVAFTDVLQLLLVVVGLLVALPIALKAVGGLPQAWENYFAGEPQRRLLLPPLSGQGPYWTTPRIIGWWDVSLMLMLGGIPWNCYFQRVLACRTPARAQAHSLFAGLMTIGLTIPPLLLGIAAWNFPWPADLSQRLLAEPALALPLLLNALPGFVGILGLWAILSAATSSFSASILSASSMMVWNGGKRLLLPRLEAPQMRRLLRGGILLLGLGAVLLALRVRSVQALWFFTSDLVFVLLFPQLLSALFDPRANRIGSISAFSISLLLRLGGGEPLLGLPPLIPYTRWFSGFLGVGAADWVDAQSGAHFFPYKTLAAVAGLLLLPVISRLTGRWDPPRRLKAASVDLVQKEIQPS